MKYSEVSPTPSHKSTPRRSGRHPTSFNVAREMPLPMRNSVAVSPSRPRVKSPFEKCANPDIYVMRTAARTKNAMNQGNWMRLLPSLLAGSFRERLRLIAAVARASGTIHRARASFTVVPMTRAWGPYFVAAPTTELVSWIASAAHSPNCDCERWSAFPIGGKISRAIEFKIKIVPSDTAISSSSARRMGPMAAMALPPQIAVPAVIRNDELPRTRNNLPNAKPRKSAKEIPSAVWINPLRPAFRTSCRFMPKPRATTELWRRVRAIPRLSLMYGCGKLSPKRIPTVRAMGGESNPVNESARPRTKIIFASVGIDWGESIRPGGGWASKKEKRRCEDAVHLPLPNSGEHHFSFCLGGVAGVAAGSDFAGVDFDWAGCARAATILEVAALLISQLRS